MQSMYLLDVSQISDTGDNGLLWVCRQYRQALIHTYHYAALGL